MDIYQERYQAHQQRKKEVLSQIIKERHSDRVFDDKPVDDKEIQDLLDSVSFCPSSCDRKAVSTTIVKDRDLKTLLGGILVGGVGWIHRASHIVLIFADPLAYKARDEIKFMPYLDAGVVIGQLYLTTAALGLKCCYVNPNIRDFNVDHFKKIFGEGVFCGAFAVGKKKD